MGEAELLARPGAATWATGSEAAGIAGPRSARAACFEACELEFLNFELLLLDLELLPLECELVLRDPELLGTHSLLDVVRVGTGC